MEMEFFKDDFMIVFFIPKIIEPFSFIVRFSLCNTIKNNMEKSNDI
jgi:hypothetical protein